MSRKRISIMLDEELDRKLHKIQAQIISKENKTVSFSDIINGTLGNGLSHQNTLPKFISEYGDKK